MSRPFRVDPRSVEIVDADVARILRTKTGAERQADEQNGIMMLSGDGLDHDYIENWADQMGLETIWRTIKFLVRQK